MEILFYIGLICLCLFINGVKSNPKIVNTISYISVCLILPVIVRSSGYGTDIISYIEYFTNPLFTPAQFGSEPILYSFQRFIFGFVRDPKYVFIISDIFILNVLWFSISRLFKGFYKSEDLYLSEKSLGFIFLAIIISWPFFTGFQNLYRQFWAVSILLCAISYSKTHPKSSFSLLILSCFTHNAVAIAIPIFLIYRSKRFSKKAPYLILIPSIPMMVYLSQFRSEFYVGEALVLSYSFFLAYIGFLFYILGIYSWSKNNLSFSLPNIISIMFLITFLSYLLLPNSQSERMALMVYSLLIPFLLLILLPFSRENKLPVQLFVLLITTPTFTFYLNSLN